MLHCVRMLHPKRAHAPRPPTCMQVLQDEPPLPPPGSVSELCRDFLATCLARDPARRPPASVLLGHPWLAGGAAGSGPGGTSLKALLRSNMLRHDDK